MGVAQRGTLVYYVGATLFWATATFGPTLQGLNQILFLACHNQTVLGGDRKLSSGCGILDPLSRAASLPSPSSVLGIKPRTLFMLGKHSTTQLYPQALWFGSVCFSEVGSYVAQAILELTWNPGLSETQLCS